MDAYDGIIEQLKKAQKRGVEAVTNRLDFVMESLDELVKEAKAAVQEALPQDAEELFPLAEVETAVAAARQRLEAVEHRAGQLHEKLGEGPAAAGLSLDQLRLLDKPRSQSDLLAELLPILTSYAGRAAVLVMRDGKLNAWSGIGFESADNLRQWQAEVDSSPVLRRFAEDSVPVRFNPDDDPVISGWLEGESPAGEALIVPVCLRGKVVGGVYVDSVEGRPWEPDSAQALVALACWLIDTLSVRTTLPSPPLAEAADLRGELAEAEEAAPVAPEEPEEADPSATMRVEAGELPAPEAPEAAPPEVEGEVEAPPAEEVAAPPPDEPPAVGPVTPPDEPAAVSPVVPPEDTLPAEEISEHQAQHDEAQRFARWAGAARTCTTASRRTSTAAARCSTSGCPPRSWRSATTSRRSWSGSWPAGIPTRSGCETRFSSGSAGDGPRGRRLRCGPQPGR